MEKGKPMTRRERKYNNKKRINHLITVYDKGYISPEQFIYRLAILSNKCSYSVSLNSFTIML